MNNPNLQAYCEGWICCPDCLTVEVFCPTCGLYTPQRRNAPPEVFPDLTAWACPGCGTSIELAVRGYQPNPTGERPAAEVLSDQLPLLERSWRTPAARRTLPPAAPPQPQNWAPCPPDAPRRRLSEWEREGLVPNELAAATIARGYRLAFGRTPAREVGRSTRIYSARELALALQALGYRPRMS